MTVTKPIVILIVSAMLAACADTSNQKQQTGAVLGGVLGGVLGSNVGHGDGRTAGTIAGVLIGVIVGSEIGKTMDENDRRMAEQTAQKTLETNPSGQSSTWSNPDSGHSGTVTPTKTWQNAQNEYCREYETEVFIDGKRETAYGTACRQPDGSWKVQP